MRARKALVTGGSRGIGRAIAAALTRAGHEVTILGRDKGALDAAIAAGHASEGKVLDVRDAEALRAFAAAHGFDILVNNAGGVTTAPFQKTDIAAFRAMFQLNVESAIAASQGALPGMIARGFGQIVNIASTAGLKGYAYTSAYSVAKHALVGLTRSLAIELVKSGVAVNAICPGFTDTDLVADSIAGVVAKTQRPATEVRAHFESSTPLGRLIQPEEVAEVALWLAAASGPAVTGQCIVVAGGEL
jgi:NAD(P)-dependent dehydrogenase (short-subunit alcohol dehydrogenase family)